MAWVDPTGDRVMVAEWRYRDDTGGNSTFFLYDLTNGELLWQSETMATADGIGWVDDHTFAAYSYPDMNSDAVDTLLIDTTSETIAHLPAAPGWQLFRVGEDLSGVTGAHLSVMPIEGGPVAELRLLPSEMHHLAAVLQPEAEITGTTVVAEVAPPVDEEAATDSGRSANDRDAAAVARHCCGGRVDTGGTGRDVPLAPKQRVLITLRDTHRPDWEE